MVPAGAGLCVCVVLASGQYNSMDGRATRVAFQPRIAYDCLGCGVLESECGVLVRSDVDAHIQDALQASVLDARRYAMADDHARFVWSTSL